MELFFIIALTHFMALLSPGPDFFLIITTLLRKSKKSAHWVCVGIALGNALILIAILSGLFLLGKINVDIIKYIQIGGAIYLIYLAYICFIYAKTPIEFDIKPTQNIHQPQLVIKNIRLGLQSSLLNPKNMMFYSSLILLIDQDFNAIQKILLSTWMISVVLIWNFFVLKLISHKKWIDWLKAKSQWLYYISSGCFLFFSMILILA
ncbi:LysE family translocator [Acinetobacter sp. ANC 4648]|uniref:LysE family translocator n=1 Tax=Acinetobacter sp. ANC 4648 TaxID=1977875 RepID=UPI000A3371EA|nr:LysE family translocator [Acinetobacter sp. ANC 4648]OTG82406.1 lysine transporter LysE [Acinetobacter sp. ANC 4648]